MAKLRRVQVSCGLREDLAASVGSQSRIDRGGIAPETGGGRERTFSLFALCLASRTGKNARPRDVARAFAARNANVVPAALLESAFYRRGNAARPDDSKSFARRFPRSIATGETGVSVNRHYERERRLVISRGVNYARRVPADLSRDTGIGSGSFPKASTWPIWDAIRDGFEPCVSRWC